MTKTNDKSITIIGNKLIVSLPNAQMPVVWQMDLEQAQSASFTIKEDKKAKSFVLISKIENDKADEIASFSDKQDSVAVLMEISSALQNIPVQTNVADNNPESLTAQKSNAKDNKIGAVLSLSLVAILIIIWIFSASNNLNTVEYNDRASNAPSSGSSGVAISADDFLSNR